jgi:hypothetical protein
MENPKPKRKKQRRKQLNINIKFILEASAQSGAFLCPKIFTVCHKKKTFCFQRFFLCIHFINKTLGQNGGIYLVQKMQFLRILW